MAVQILGVAHSNVNCSDLARSTAFYIDLLGLEVLAHTNPPPQDGAGFGLAGKIQWDAHMLHDARGRASAALDLLEWKLPRPCGRPVGEANHTGFARLCFATPDAIALHDRLAAAGVPCVHAPLEYPLDRAHTESPACSAVKIPTARCSSSPSVPSRRCG